MTINITGPKKYDFQDLVCVAIGLRFARQEGAELFIEPDGGEDCEVRLNGRTTEVQVKGAGGSFGIKELADYLGHPGKNVADNTLLERLVSDSSRYVVLVLSSRSDDATSSLVNTIEWEPEERSHSFGVANAKALLQTFGSPSPDKNPTDLTKKRSEHRKTVATSLTPGALNSALKRLIVIERLEEQGLTAFCESWLVRDHDVPRDRLGQAIGDLRAAVKDAKGKDTNALPALKGVLEKFSAGSLLPEGYIERGDETAWMATLSADRALLLTGRPRSGKSDAAKYVASRFQKFGYTVRLLSDVKEAERFLSEPSSSQRLVVLDDPLGGTHAEPDHLQIYQRLEDLLGRLRNDRRLVVAQSQEQLLLATGASNVSKLETDRHRWHDLGQPNAAFVASVWSQEVSSSSVPADLAQFVGEALSTGRLVLDAGAVRHLASHSRKIEHPYSIGQLERIAHERANALAQVWKKEGLQPLSRSLAIGTTAVEPIAEIDLAFLLGKGGSGLPGMPEGVFSATQIGGDIPEPEPDADYDEPPTLAEVESERLEALEVQRVISLSLSGKLNFAHAYYRAAGEALADASTAKQAEAAVSTLERGLFCKTAVTSRAAARNLNWLHDRLARSGRDLAVPELAERGLKSYFPATRDLCYAFLLRHLLKLPVEYQARLPQWVDAIKRCRLETMEWRDGEARLPLGRTRSVAISSTFQFSVDRDDVLSELSL